MNRSYSSAHTLLVAGAFFMENLHAYIIQAVAPAIAQYFSVSAVNMNVLMVR